MLSLPDILCYTTMSLVRASVLWWLTKFSVIMSLHLKRWEFEVFMYVSRNPKKPTYTKISEFFFTDASIRTCDNIKSKIQNL